MNVLDLFSGIGGFSLGLERAGMRTVAFCEIDPYCQAVLRKHWPDVPIYRDVRELKAKTLGYAHAIGCGWWTDDEREISAGRDRSEKPSIDVICGGFPCQDLSVAGKGAGIKGSRSGLWSEYARIIGEVRPRWVIIENVSALLSGSDEYELPNDRCLCGWPYRWRGLYQHRASQRAGVLSPHRCWNEHQGSANSGVIEEAIRGINPVDAATNGKVGRGEGLGVVRSAIDGFSGSNFSTSGLEARASGSGFAIAEDDRFNAEDAQWLGIVDGGGQEKRQGDPRSDAGSEPQGAAALALGGMVCEACGRNLDNAATRFSNRSWMGRVLWDLAQIGFHAEFHCIPASAVGAPHRRDRVWVVAYAARDVRAEQEAGGAERQRIGQRSQSIDVADAGGTGLSPSERQTILGAGWWDEGRATTERGWWLAEPNVGRVAHGVPFRVDRLRALGNAIVPQIAETIGKAIMAQERL